MKPTAPDTPITWVPNGTHPFMAFCDMFRAARSDGTLTAFAGKEPAGWHVSISHPTRIPTWGEVLAARELAPDDVTMAILFPPAAEYVNVHETCLHLWEVQS